MKKQIRVWSLVLAAALLLGLAGCGKGQDKEQDKEQLTAEQIAEKLAEQAAFPDLQSAVDYMDVFYSQLDLDKVEQYEVLSPMMNVQASEIAVFQVKEEGDVEAVRQAVEQRAQDIQTSFEHYLEDQYEIAKQAEIKVKDKTICLIIDENAADLSALFDEIA